MHILRSSKITQPQLSRATELLQTFVNEYEVFYGESNMVFNVHQLLHLVDCVKHNGPLSLYSTYCMEDFIGHLVSLVHGTTDVAQQICEKYLLEKNLIRHLDNSLLAKTFYDQIHSNVSFSTAQDIGNTLVVGKPTLLANNDYLIMIKENLNLPIEEQIFTYNSVLWNKELYYEKSFEAHEHRGSKRTYDAFILNNDTKNFGEIKCIFVVGNQLYYLIHEKYKALPNDPDSPEHIIFLDLIDSSQLKIITCASIGPKYAFVKFGNTLSCSKFPNLYERN